MSMPPPMKRRVTPACPRCGSSEVAWILRGEPAMSDRLQADLDAHRVILGGCLVWPDQSDHRCRACRLDFRGDGRPVRVPGADR
jgi:hypothetical protein